MSLIIHFSFNQGSEALFWNSWHFIYKWLTPCKLGTFAFLAVTLCSFSGFTRDFWYLAVTLQGGKWEAVKVEPFLQFLIIPWPKHLFMDFRVYLRTFLSVARFLGLKNDTLLWGKTKHLCMKPRVRLACIFPMSYDLFMSILKQAVHFSKANKASW